ncbi:MAG: rhamnulokinase [Clostridia bacterium]|nr:rhamnulokinase [Clostridia bacterium]
MKYYLAIDIGASSGRHIVGWVEDGEICTREVYRFANGMDTVEGHLVWNTERLFSEVKAGIAKAFAEYPKIESLSIDTWGVDYVLMRGEEEILPTYAYRDSRTEEPIRLVHEIVPPAELFSITGTQFQSFNTVYQLYADKLCGRLDGATDFLMIPEYLMYKLTGVKKKEFTNASTCALVNVNTLQLDEGLFERLGFPRSLIAPIYMPGELVGRLSAEVAREVGGDLDVVLCATHDTASAVEAIEMESDAPYISSGTWSLLGVKLDEALTDERSRLSGYSNEGGVGYFTYLKNITGMWIIQSLRSELCPETGYGEIAEMARKSSFNELFDVNDPAFMAPESMKAAISEYLAAHGKATPKCAADYFNSAYHSLASCYEDAIRDLEENVKKEYSEIYIVGGGAKNGYLNDLTARYTGRRVVAMPIEATAIGNLMVQMKCCGELDERADETDEVAPGWS